MSFPLKASYMLFLTVTKSQSIHVLKIYNKGDVTNRRFPHDLHSVRTVFGFALAASGLITSCLPFV